MRDKIERHMREHEHGEVEPPAHTEPSGGEMERELDQGFWGPGVQATKSQTIGGVLGTVIGALLGGLIGLVIGLVLFSGQMLSLVITIVVGMVAGATALGTAGGFVYNRGRQERGEPDV